MKNKKAQAFSLILVLITLFMCGSSVYVYKIQQGNAESSLVSPLLILEIRDDLEIFEMREKELIEKSLGEVNEEFGTDDFLNLFRGSFIEGVKNDNRMTEFIFSNLTWNGRVMNIDFAFNEDSFLENIVYPEIVNEGGYDEFIFVRERIGKKIYLSANDKTKTNFPVDFLFEFERKYLISKSGEKIEVSAV